MTELSIHKSKQGGDNAARFVCKSAHIAANGQELLDALTALRDVNSRSCTQTLKRFDAWNAADVLIKKIEGKL